MAKPLEIWLGYITSLICPISGSIGASWSLLGKATSLDLGGIYLAQPTWARVLQHLLMTEVTKKNCECPMVLKFRCSRWFIIT